MTRLFHCLWLTVLVGWLFAAPAAADERILHFHSQVTVHPDASLTVKETITVRAEHRQLKRGLIREFPVGYRAGWGLKSTVGFEVQEVTRDGRPEPFVVESTSTTKKVRIGQKEVFLEKGLHTYAITYRTTRQLGFFKDYDELYWNVTGDQWTFPIDQAKVTITLPPGAKVLQSAAYTGRPGEKGQDFVESRTGRGQPVFATTRILAPGEGFTIAVAWPKGLVREPSQSDKIWFLLQDNAALSGGLFCLLILGGYYLWAWFRVGKDPPAGVIVPLYTPPEGFSPAAAGYLWRLGFDDKIFTAAVVDLAVRGCLLIQESNDTYTLVKTQKPCEVGSSSGELGLYSSLFSGRKSLELKQENHEAVRAARSALSDSLSRKFKETYFTYNIGYQLIGILITVLSMGYLVVTGHDPIPGIFVVLWTGLWTAGVLYLLYFAFKKWKSLIIGGYFRGKLLWGALGATLFALLFLGGEILGLVFVTMVLSPGATVSLVALVVLNVIFGHLLKAPSVQGRRLLDQLEGFRMFLSVSEQERLNLLNPPEKTPELFEKYLPYALALDVEVAWCEQFADLLAAAGTEKAAYSPAWYSGRSWDSFSASDFGSSLGGSLSSAISTASSPPGSSSGSGGGGFSGGGGGGGGGSGW